MDLPTWILVTGVFVAGWLLIPAIIVHYRLTSVVHRYNEVLDAFLWRGAPKSTDVSVPSENLNRFPAWHYAKALRPHEAEKKPVSYADLIRPIEEQYESLHGPKRYAFPLLLVAFFAGVDLVACHSWVIDQLVELQKGTVQGLPMGPFFFPVIHDHVAAALAGAYVWSLYEIITRRNTRDLTSEELYPIAFRLATALPIGLALAQSLANDRTYSAVAFVATAFPIRDVLRLIRQNSIKGYLQDPVSREARRKRGYLAETLQGFDLNTMVRLEELNIATVLDMAYADPVRLMFRTGRPLRQVISWLDESLLAVYAGPRTGDLARLGIPCSIDVVDIWRRYTGELKAARPEIESVISSLAESLGMKEPVLQDLLRRVAIDPHVQFIVSVWEA